MNKQIERKIEVEATTGEVYFDYSEYADQDRHSLVHQIALWIQNRINAHLERVAELRVYDHRRVDEQ